MQNRVKGRPWLCLACRLFGPDAILPRSPFEPGASPGCRERIRGGSPTPLSLTPRKAADRIIIHCAGSLLLGDEADALRDMVRKFLPDARVIILDLAELISMDSAGIGTLAGLSVSARNAGCSLRLARPSTRIRTLFQLTRLSAVFEIVETPEAAAAP